MANERLKTSAFGSMPVEAQVDINCKPSIGNKRTKHISGDVLGVTNFNANVVVKADVTATGSFIIGSASMNEADLEKILH